MLRRDALRMGVLAATGLLVRPGIVRAQTVKRGGMLVYAAGTDVQTLDPQFITDIPTSRVVMQLYDTLVTQDEQGHIQPALAVSWTTSDDKRTWTFKLREGVTFHDGTSLDAAAVKFTFDRLRDPATGSPRRSGADAFDRVEVVDEGSVAISTKDPYAPLLATLSAYNLAILSPAQVAKAGPKFREQPAGTGPFRLQSWRPGEKIVLVRNDTYWGGAPLLDGVEARVVPEDSARVLLLLSGGADVIAGVPTLMLRRLQASPAVRLLRRTGFRTIYVGLNTAIPPFDDLRVRQAVAHAIDTKALLEGVLGGVGTLGGGIESPAIDGAVSLPPYPHDPGKSRQLLRQAGHPDGFETRFYVPTGRYLMDRQLGEAIQAQLATVGIRASIQSPEFGTFMSLVDAKNRTPMFLLGKGSPTGDLDFTLTLTQSSGGKMNDSNLHDPEIDRLIVEQRSTLNEKQRRDLLKRIQEQVYASASQIVLFYEDQLFATAAGVHDVTLYANEFVSFRRAWKA